MIDEMASKVNKNDIIDFIEIVEKISMEEFNKNLLVYAIIGKNDFTLEDAVYHETKTGLMEFCGDQHNPDWRWKRSEMKIYTKGDTGK